jgi:hypothetical protein
MKCKEMQQLIQITKPYESLLVPKYILFQFSLQIKTKNQLQKFATYLHPMIRAVATVTMVFSGLDKLRKLDGSFK